MLVRVMADHAGGIYVEVDIRGSIERVWELTQTPELHRRWDLRFTDIRYLPRADPGEPQRFLYTTRIGFGLVIRGEGETVGQRDGADGRRSSALRFWSDDSKSLIREGSGYWQYVPMDGEEDGLPVVRFLTGYDYRVRFGSLGRLVDRFVFRPLMGWATAWSFDRLRLWVERGIEPEISMRRSVAHAVARAAVSLVWVYHGVVPKLIARHADESAMLRDAGVPADAVPSVLLTIGWAEVAFGLLMLVAWRWRWPLWLSVVAMPLAAIAVAVNSPTYLSAAFNPVSLNLAVAAMAVVALIEGRDLPSAARCRRRPRSPGEGAG
jgi:hypothetical protein